MDKFDKTFQAIDRADFLTKEMQNRADLDAPIPIGFGQTNSQPTTVRLMLSWLDPDPGNKVLDVGSGSGWTTALLAYLVGPTGKVYAVEKVPELVTFGAQNCRRLGVDNVRFSEAGAEYGLPQFAPYDCILVSAATDDLPKELVAQLKEGGRLVIPIRNGVYVIDKTSKGGYTTIEHPGFIFVPLL